MRSIDLRLQSVALCQEISLRRHATSSRPRAMAEARSGNKVGGSRLICAFRDVCGCDRRSLVVVARAISNPTVPARLPLLAIAALFLSRLLSVKILSVRAISA